MCVTPVFNLIHLALLLLLIGPGIATFYLKSDKGDAEVPYSFCTNQRTPHEHCTTSYFKLQRCFNMSMHVDMGDEFLVRLVADGKTVFVTNSSSISFLKNYIDDIFCERPVSPLILEKITHKEGSNVWLRIQSLTLLSTWNYTQEDYRNSSTKSVEICCGRLAEISVNVRDSQDKMPSIGLAIMFGDLGALKTIINKGGNPTFINKDINMTIMHAAAHSCNAEIIKYLIDIGESVDVTSIYGDTPLHFATKFGYLNSAKLLLNAYSGNVNAKDSEGKAAIHYASKLEETAMVDLLISSGADLLTTDSKGYTALHYAACHGEVGTIERLVKSGSPLDVKDSLSRTPLIVAALKGSTKNINVLLKLGANVHAADSKNKTALEYSREANNMQD